MLSLDWSYFHLVNSIVSLWLFYLPLTTKTPATMSHFPKARLDRLEHVSVCFMFLPVRISCVMCVVLCVCVRERRQQGVLFSGSQPNHQPWNQPWVQRIAKTISVAVNIYLVIFGNVFGPWPLRDCTFVNNNYNRTYLSSSSPMRLSV